MKPIYPGYNKGYGMYGTPPSVYGGYTTSKPPTGDEPDDQEAPAVSVFDPNSYVNNYINRINMYTTAQNQYKTDRLNVKVNWNFQDGKYEYLRNQHGIHPKFINPSDHLDGHTQDTITLSMATKNLNMDTKNLTTVTTNPTLSLKVEVTMSL